MQCRSRIISNSKNNKKGDLRENRKDNIIKVNTFCEIEKK